MIFEVPQNAKLITLRYDDHVISSPHGEYDHVAINL
jgi:hypothetical protein